jgi:hypothetical protein
MYDYTKNILVQPSRDLPPLDDSDMEDENYKNQVLEEELYNASIINKKAKSINIDSNSLFTGTKKKVALIKKPQNSLNDIINSNNITKTIFTKEIVKQSSRQFNPRLPLPLQTKYTTSSSLQTDIDMFPVLKN